MNRRAFLVNFAAISTLSYIEGCTYFQPLNVGIHSWIGYETIEIAREFNWFSNNIQFHNNAMASESIRGLLSGQLNAACLTLDEVLQVRAQGLPLTVVLVFDISSGADVVLARPEIRNLSDIKGKRIGVEQGALGSLVAGALLETAKLKHSSVTLIDCPPTQQLSAWKNNDVDIVISYSPSADLILNEGAHVIFNSLQMPNTIIDVLAVRNDQSQQKIKALKELVAVHFRSLNYINTNRQDASYRIAAHQNTSPQLVQKSLSGIVQSSLLLNREYLGINNARLLKAAKNISTTLVQYGLLKKDDELVNLTDFTYLPNQEYS